MSTWSQAWGTCLPLPHIYLGLFSCFLCHQYPELLVASYNNNEDAPHEPDGVALVWNMKYRKATPEYVFHCQVLKAPLLLSLSPPCVLTSGFLHDKCGALPANSCLCTPHPPPPLVSVHSLPSCLHAHCELTILASSYTTSIHKHMFTWRRRRCVVQD